MGENMESHANDINILKQTIIRNLDDLDNFLNLHNIIDESIRNDLKSLKHCVNSLSDNSKKLDISQKQTQLDKILNSFVPVVEKKLVEQGERDMLIRFNANLKLTELRTNISKMNLLSGAPTLKRIQTVKPLLEEKTQQNPEVDIPIFSPMERGSLILFINQVKNIVDFTNFWDKRGVGFLSRKTPKHIQKLRENLKDFDSTKPVTDDDLRDYILFIKGIGEKKHEVNPAQQSEKKAPPSIQQEVYNALYEALREFSTEDSKNRNFTATVNLRALDEVANKINNSGEVKKVAIEDTFSKKL
jgi:hypothetical protein